MEEEMHKRFYEERQKILRIKSSIHNFYDTIKEFDTKFMIGFEHFVKFERSEIRIKVSDIEPIEENGLNGTYTIYDMVVIYKEKDVEETYNATTRIYNFPSIGENFDILAIFQTN